MLAHPPLLLAAIDAEIISFTYGSLIDFNTYLTKVSLVPQIFVCAVVS
jgi:hypothetical protein